MSTVSPGTMKTETAFGRTATSGHELKALQPDWIWFLVLGVALMSLGVLAIASAFFVSVFTVVMFGLLLLMGGIGLVVSSFWTGQWSGFLLHLLQGLLYLIVGILIVDTPVESTLALSLMMAVFFMVAGVFRIIASLVLRFPNWGWPLLSGFVALLLGILIYRQWPASGLWVIGLFVGIEMIFYGWSWVMLAFNVRDIDKVRTKGTPTAGAAVGGGI